MNRKITKDELIKLSNDELIKITKDRAIDIHMYNGSFAQLCVNDFKGLDNIGYYYVTQTEIQIPLNNVEYIEII